ncbi:MAG: ADOP family duplicated permease [Vicinamibacterales bacterium]
MPANPLFDAALRLLPRDVRDEFADEMAAVFHADLRDYPDAAGRAAVWTRTLASIAWLAVTLQAGRLRTDVRDAWRAIAARPAPAATVVGILALAFGPLLVVFVLADAVVIRPLPFPDADRLVSVGVTNEARGLDDLPMTEADLLDFVREQPGTTAIAGWSQATVALGAADGPVSASALVVAGDIAAVLGVPPARGRAFGPGDQRPGAPPVALISHDLWRTAFGGRAGVVGAEVTIDGRSHTVIGILPAGLGFPRNPADLWLPARLDPATVNRGMHYMSVAARLAPGVPMAEAEARFRAQALSAATAYPATNAGESVRLQPLARAFTAEMPRLVAVLAAAALAVLLLALTNVAGLLAVRAAARDRDVAVRAALGASPARLRRAQLTEHLLLTFAAAIAGGGAAWLLTRTLGATGLLTSAVLERATLDGTDALVLLGVATGTAVLLSRIAGGTARRTGAATLAPGVPARSTASREALRLRQVLVACQVAATVALLVTAGLMLRSAAQLAGVQPGFSPDHVLTLTVSLPPPAYADAADRVRVVTRITGRLAALPGVEAAADAGMVPLANRFEARSRFVVAGRPAPPQGAEPSALVVPAGPGYLAALRMPLLAGRWFDDRDRLGAPLVVVVTAAFAREFFPGEDPLGQRLRLYTSRPDQEAPMPEIVGVVGDIRQVGLADAPEPLFYRPQRQWDVGQPAFFVRTAGDPARLGPAVQAAVAAVAPDRPVEHLMTMDAVLADSVAPWRALTWLLVTAAAGALAISMAGLYGVTAATVAGRRRELAIRAAIGARPNDLARLVLSGIVPATAAGLATGLGTALVMARLVETRLYDVAPTDQLTFAAVPVLLAGAALAAVVGPMRRAGRTQPARELTGD